MPCYHPIKAWRTPQGEVVLGKDRQDGTRLHLPCGNCLGCRTNYAQAWALRCQLEYHEHTAAIFATLTFAEEHLPLTLSKRHVSDYIRKIRKEFPNRLRFFASGEYGETTGRPHYHAIIYGLSKCAEPRLAEAWEKGHIKVDSATPANIAYTAGYCSKKIGYRRYEHERVDAATGQRYTWQPPFILMSRNPGIGATAKKYLNSWRLYAVKDGHKMPVPRYFKKHWKDNATPEELDQLAQEIAALNKDPLTRQQLDAAEKIAAQRHKMAGERRKL